ncbi:MAG: hypothetical protein RIT81_45295 [Deltaproteobacteria bacterium]
MSGTPNVTGTNPNRFFQIDRIEQNDRIQLQNEGRQAVEDLAEEVAGPASQRPTTQTAADARAAIAFDPTTQQIVAGLDAMPTAELNDDGTFAVTGTEGDDQILVEERDDVVSAYYTDANGEQHLIGSADASEVERVEVNAGEGDDIIVNDADAATLDAGEGDDVVINTHGGATIAGGEGSNEIYNSGDDVTIGAGEDVDSTDAVFSAGDGVTIDYANGGGHNVASIGNDGTIGVNGDGANVNVVGDGNALNLGGSTSFATVQGDTNAVTSNVGGNAVAVAGDGNAIDLAGGGNLTEIVGDQNVFVGDDPAGIALANFDELDVDGDGFLRAEELAQIPGGEALVEASDALMFGSIESGNEAWHGVSRADLEQVNAMIAEDPSLTVDDVAQQLRESSWLGQRIAASGDEVTAESFSAAVAEHRGNNEVDAIDGLAPLELDPNVVNLWGDGNGVAATAPNTWVQFAGNENNIALGGDMSAVFGYGDANQIALAGEQSLASFAGNMNGVLSGGGNAILGFGNGNMVESVGEDQVFLDGGYNFYNGQLQMPLLPYFTSMGPDFGYSEDELMQMLFAQREQGVF